VIILGGGPAGACTAMYLLRRGDQAGDRRARRVPNAIMSVNLDWRDGLALKELGLGRRSKRRIIR